MRRTCVVVNEGEVGERRKLKEKFAPSRLGFFSASLHLHSPHIIIIVILLCYLCLTNHPTIPLPDYLCIFPIISTIAKCLLRWMPRAASSCRRSSPWRGPATIAASLATRVGPIAITLQVVVPADQQSLPGIINTLCPLLPSTLAPPRSSCRRRPTRRSHRPARCPTPSRLPCLSSLLPR